MRRTTAGLVVDAVGDGADVVVDDATVDRGALAPASDPPPQPASETSATTAAAAPSTPLLCTTAGKS
jgi:hypothetical protein